MYDTTITTPSYFTPCLVHIKHLGWIEAELSYIDNNDDMYYPHYGLNTIKYEVWWCGVTDSYYELTDVDFWIYLNELHQLKQGD